MAADPRRPQVVSFSVEHQAWHWEANRATGMRPTIFVQAGPEAGSAADWQFAVSERDHDHGRRPIAVTVFDEAFAAFRDIPQFFAALDSATAMSLLDVHDILKGMGAVDVTPYEVPANLRIPGERRYAS